MIQLTHLFRHPIKGLGAEALVRTALEAGRAMAADRAYALAHGKAEEKALSGAWADCENYVRCATSPRLAQLTAAMEPATMEPASNATATRLRLAHPDLGAGAFELSSEAGRDALAAWLAPIISDVTPGPYRLAPAAEGGAYGDADDLAVTLLSHASLRALSQQVGQPLDPKRFRGNLWVDGGAPWEELEWEGRELQLGAVRLRVIERTPRCMATAANPATGRRDAFPAKVLRQAYGHADFGVLASVVEGGEVAIGDRLTPL